MFAALTDVGDVCAGEFLALMVHLKLHPDPFSKTVLGRIYKQANAADEVTAFSS